MSTFRVTIGAGGQAILPGGDNLVLLVAPDDVTIELRRDGQRVERAQNVPVSYYWRSAHVDPNREAFDAAIISSATAQTIEVDISRGASGVNTVVGSVNINSPDGIAQTDAAATADGATVTVPANGSRAALTIYSDPANVGYLRVGPAAAAGAGFPIPPGGSITLNTSAAVDVHNESGAAASWGYLEETA